MKRLLLIWALINALLCIPLALISRSQGLKLSSLGSDTQETQTIEQDLVHLKQRLALLEADNHAAAADLSSLQVKITADNTPDLSPVEHQAQLDRLLLQTPEYHRYIHIYWRRYVQKQYGNFLKQQSLTPDQINRFKELRVELISSINDAAAAAIDQGLDENSKLSQTAVERTQKNVEAEIHDLIGEKAFAAYQRSGSTPDQKLQYYQLTLADQGLPQLSPEQAQVVTEAYYNNSGFYWDKQTLEHLSQQLSPEQFKALNDHNKANKTASDWDAKIRKQVRATPQ